MITKDTMMELMLQSCPTFAPKWQEFVDEWRLSIDALPLYIALLDLAWHLIELMDRNEVERFPAIFQVVEDWHILGDEYVREAATVGLLEDLQNLNNHRGSTTPEQFRALLGPESLRCWDQLASEWAEFFRQRAAAGYYEK